MKQFILTLNLEKYVLRKKLHVFFTRFNQLELLLLYISYITTLNHFYYLPLT